MVFNWLTSWSGALMKVVYKCSSEIEQASTPLSLTSGNQLIVILRLYFDMLSTGAQDDCQAKYIMRADYPATGGTKTCPTFGGYALARAVDANRTFVSVTIGNLLSANLVTDLNEMLIF
jgi:hypothetical protein